MKYIKNKWLVMAVLLLAVGALTAFKLEGKKAPQYFTQKVQTGNIQNVVQATGSINAVTTVQVGSQVSGTILTLYADFNSHVSKGQVVARIDPSLFQGALLQAKADLSDAQANLTAAKANLTKAQAAAVQAKQDFDRYTTLAKEGVVPTQQLDTARASSQSADAAVGAAKAQVTQAAAQVQQKSAAVTVAQANLDHTIIRSPIDGTVVARSVDVGQTVAASLQAPTLFTIAQDLTKMQVYVSTDESDVGNIHPGQQVNFKVDAFPTQTFNGKVSAVRLNATTVQNVVTYTTVVDFANPETFSKFPTAPCGTSRNSRLTRAPPSCKKSESPAMAGRDTRAQAEAARNHSRVRRRPRNSRPPLWYGSWMQRSNSNQCWSDLELLTTPTVKWRKC